MAKKRARKSPAAPPKEQLAADLTAALNAAIELAGWVEDIRETPNRLDLALLGAPWIAAAQQLTEHIVHHVGAIDRCIETLQVNAEWCELGHIKKRSAHAAIRALADNTLRLLAVRLTGWPDTFTAPLHEVIPELQHSNAYLKPRTTDVISLFSSTVPVSPAQWCGLREQLKEEATRRKQACASDTKSDTRKKSQQTKWHMNADAVRCAERIRKLRKSDPQVKMQEVVTEMAEEGKFSAPYVIRILNAHPEEWKSDREPSDITAVTPTD